MAIRRILTFGLIALAVVGTACQTAAAQGARTAGSSASDPIRSLLVHGTLDQRAIDPIIAEFHATHPRLRVEYRELNSIALFTGFLQAVDARRPTPDLVMSSAIDLQMKLVNDGHAIAHDTPDAALLPRWAIWRNEAFAFSVEPVVTVYNNTTLAPDLLPRSRYRLLELFESHTDLFTGRVGTYDPAKSGTGYLYLTQDIEQSPIVWELTRALGLVGVRMFSTSSGIIDAVVSGDLLVGYNVVGSYAFARAATDPALEVVLPEDYTLVVSRTAFIARRGRHPEEAKVFLDFLLSRDGQRIIVERSGLFPIRTDIEGPTMVELSRRTFRGARPVRMSPGLLVYVDSMKREKVLRRWLDAMRSGAPRP